MFNGYKQKLVRLDRGDLLTLSNMVQTQSGTLETALLDSSKQVLSAFTGSGMQTLSIPDSASYWIRITADSHRGSFALSWSNR